MSKLLPQKPFELDYFRLVPPITVIFSLTERTMQEEPLPNSQYVPYTHRKFFRGLWSQKFTENWQFRVFLDTPREIVFLFQNNVLLWRFFRYLAIGTSYVQDFLLTSRTTLRQPFRCPQYILWSHRNFFRGIWSDWSPVLHQKSNFLAHTSISKIKFKFAFFPKFFTFRAIYFDWCVLNTFTFHCR